MIISFITFFWWIIGLEMRMLSWNGRQLKLRNRRKMQQKRGRSSKSTGPPWPSLNFEPLPARCDWIKPPKKHRTITAQSRAALSVTWACGNSALSASLSIAVAIAEWNNYPISPCNKNGRCVHGSMYVEEPFWFINKGWPQLKCIHWLFPNLGQWV